MTDAAVNGDGASPAVPGGARRRIFSRRSILFRTLDGAGFVNATLVLMTARRFELLHRAEPEDRRWAIVTVGPLVVMIKLEQ